jgi:hypothetical protein
VESDGSICFCLEGASNFGGRRTIIEDGGRASKQAGTALKIPLHGTFFGSRIKDDRLSTVSWAKERHNRVGASRGFEGRRSSDR